MNFSRAVRAIRKDLGLTQSELAKKAKVSQSLICKIEDGKLDPKAGVLMRIFKVLLKE